MRPQVVEGQACVSVPRWGREAPGGGLLSWRETPRTPEGGGPWGYHLSHIIARRRRAKYSSVSKLNSFNLCWVCSAFLILRFSCTIKGVRPG